MPQNDRSEYNRKYRAELRSDPVRYERYLEQKHVSDHKLYNNDTIRRRQQLARCRLRFWANKWHSEEYTPSLTDIIKRAFGTEVVKYKIVKVEMDTIRRRYKSVRISDRKDIGKKRGLLDVVKVEFGIHRDGVEYWVYDYTKNRLSVKELYDEKGDR